MIRPRDLPTLRNQTLKHVTDPTSALRTGVRDQDHTALDLLARHLRAADLYWVAEPMTALAMSAGGQLAAASWGPDDRPAPCGLLLWDGGVGMVNRGLEVTVDACTWGPAPGGVMVWLLTRRARIAEALTGRGVELVAGDVPPLVPLAAWTIPASGEVSMAAIPEDPPVPVMACLAASWLLMQQPTLTDRSTVRPDARVRGVTTRLGMPDPEVTLVDLRRRYVPDDREETGVGGGRRYKHRWVVSGHWRNAWRPSVQEHRRIWVPAHIKGPEGAPLLKTEKVNVWRR